MAQAEKQGRYAIVDTTLTKVDATLIDALSGRQGDRGRIVYFAMKDGNLPHNLDGQDVQLSVKDAAGKVKILTGIYDVISATAGLFSMLIPAEFYQAAGDVEEAYLSLIDNNNTVISTIPIAFTVFPNGIIISANASKEYLSSVQDLIDAANKKINDLQSGIDVQQTAYETLQQALDNITSMINNNQVPTLGGINDFLGNNTFEKKINAKSGVIGNLIGNADSATLSNLTNITVKDHLDIDLNDLPPITTAKKYQVYYFTNPLSVKNVPKNYKYGIVENYAVTTNTIMQRFTSLNGLRNETWNRIIKGWGDSKVDTNYSKWNTINETTQTTINAFGGKLKFVRSGNVVTISAGIHVNYKFNNFSLIYSAGTIPAGYRPAINYAGIELETPTWLKGGNRNPGALEFGASGWIGARSAFVKDSSKSWITINGTYITNDSMPG